jgi:hypothetical protein
LVALAARAVQRCRLAVPARQEASLVAAAVVQPVTGLPGADPPDMADASGAPLDEVRAAAHIYLGVKVQP